MGKQLGMSYEGMEKEVINKLVELENQDAERYARIDKGGTKGQL